VNTDGLALKAKVHSAKIPDQDCLMMMLKSARAGVSRLKRLWLDAGYGGKGKKWAEDGPLGLAWRPPCASLRSPYVGEGGEGVGRGAGQVGRGGRLAKAHAPAKLQSVTPQKGGGAYLLAVEPIPAHEQGPRAVVRHRGYVHPRSSDDTLDGEAAGPCLHFSDSLSGTFGA
jgi:hypothetical protein